MELVSSLARIQIQDTFPLKLPFLALNSGLNTNAQNCAVSWFLPTTVASYQERSKHSLFHSVETGSSPKWVTWVDSSEDSRHGSLVMPLLAFESHFCQPTQGPFPLPLHCSLFQPLVLFPHLFTGRFSCLLVSTLLIPLSSPSLVSLENFNHGSAGSLTM